MIKYASPQLAAILAVWFQVDCLPIVQFSEFLLQMVHFLFPAVFLQLLLLVQLQKILLEL
jgi:hypothetical protein